MTLTVGSLFSGIGGIDLGLERAGMKVIWQSELDPYASRVLAKHWPDVPNLGDVKLIDWSTIERPDLICGGFPCQPVSTAGRRRGQADERWLWPEVARCLRHLGPRWALLENVSGLLTAGMGDVLGDLASLGYDAEWQGIPAAAVGAPHLRWRVFVVAHTTISDGVDVRRGRGDPVGSGGGAWSRAIQQPCGPGLGRGTTTLADTHGQGSQGWVFGSGRPSQRALGPGGLAHSGHWDVEPDVGRVAHGVPRRVDRLRCLGNAVVPQVAEYVGRLILAADCHCGCHQTVQPGLIPCPTCATDPDHSSRTVPVDEGA